MKLTVCGLLVGIGVSIAMPSAVDALGNSTVEAIAQGTIVQFSGREAVSEPSAFEVTIATKDKGLNIGLAVGQPIALTVAPGRTVSGMVESLEQIDSATAQGLYRLRLVPSLERLKYRSTSRTFYNMNVVQVATAVMNEAGVANIELRIGNALSKNELTIQYRETDLAFVSRLLEEAGIHYHFEPSDKLVLGDANVGFPPGISVNFNPAPGAGPSVFSFMRGQTLHSGQVQAGDYNWKTPTVDQTGVAQASVFVDLSDQVFPAGTGSKLEAQAQAAIRLTSHIAESQVCRGESTIPQLQAGQRITLQGHPRADFNQEYVILSVEHQRAKDYRNTFRCIPAQIAYRPLATTPKPVVAGFVPGIVVGPPGETKFVDQYGRVKVRFPWRAAQHTAVNDPGDAGFVRVSQIAAGAGSAALWLPEVGDEVLVAFEHGDPDRPVVVGSVYNGKDMPPVSLPAQKHVALLRAQVPNGAKIQMVYDSTPGNERLALVSGQSGVFLGANALTLQGTTVAIASAGDLSVKSAGNLSLATQKDAAMSVGGNTLINNAGVLRATVGSDMQLSVGANLQSTVGGAAVLDHGKDLTLRVGQNLLLQAARVARLTVGEDLLMQSGRSLVANAGAMFQFVAAQTGTIDARGGLFLKSATRVDLESAQIAVKSAGDLLLKGSKITQN